MNLKDITNEELLNMKEEIQAFLDELVKRKEQIVNESGTRSENKKDKR